MAEFMGSEIDQSLKPSCHVRGRQVSPAFLDRTVRASWERSNWADPKHDERVGGAMVAGALVISPTGTPPLFAVSDFHVEATQARRADKGDDVADRSSRNRGGVANLHGVLHV
jgi:hypothetical protein